MDDFWSSWTAWPHGVPPPWPRTTCGSTGVQGLAGVNAHVMACFAMDVLACRAGSMVFIVGGVDTATDMHATLRPGTSPCQVAVVMHQSTANFEGRTSPADRLDCTISRVAERLHVVCPHNNVADWPIN